MVAVPRPPFTFSPSFFFLSFFLFHIFICFIPMEHKKQATSYSTSSSFTNELFGSKDPSASSSSGLFNSIFPPPSKVHTRDHIRSVETDKCCDSSTEQCSTIHSVNNEDRSRNPKTDTSRFYQQETSQPCHLSSSIYYGGQDVYTNPRITTPAHSTQYTKDGEDDGRASRGNWWQGSLYY
ncbi:uncharacterized protein LOC143553632 isoform X3 [Bidens hawaiensis]|uniref:uncharacterized protein LOC143553632 isoform X3 n=1 Tax=Bidens hawaiensis TaxID=980011 RepID=UPI004049A732